jgi:hypothetical protein
MTARKVLRLTTFALVLTFTTLPAAFSAERECNGEARAWVAAQGRNLPRTYEEISTFPVNYRRAIYTALLPEEKSALWQQQLELHLSQDRWTQEQRDTLLEAIQLATPDTFAVVKDKQNWRYRQMIQQIEQLESRARAVFGHDEAAAIFGVLGPVESEVTRQSDSPSQRGLITAPMATSTAGTACSCSDRSDYCNSAYNCTLGGCNTIADECGTFWSYTCDGLCQNAS